LQASDFQQKTDYFDGLGREVQSTSLGASPLGKDVVQPMAYDEFGRESRKYLPFSLGARDGRYQPTATFIQGDFYIALNNKVATDLSPFSETIFEPSPLNHVIKQGAPGVAWQPNAENAYNAADQTVKYAYEYNVGNEVLLWSFVYPTEDYSTTAINAFGKVNAGTAASPIHYSAGQLQRNKIKDEHGNQIIEYLNKQGKTVLKRKQAVAGSPSTTDSNKDLNYASTYYIYDHFDNLVCVIPPEATKRLAAEYFQASAADFTKNDLTKNDFLKRWAFRYRWDARKRMVLKQVPGAEPVYMVYDNRDRLILTQDGNQRTGTPSTIKYWTFTKYDELNRPILTGIKDTTVVGATVLLTQVQMQAAVNAHFAKANARWGETYVGNVAGNVHGYTNRAYPVRTGAATEVNPDKYLTVTYYDNYNFRSLWVGSYNYLNESLSESVNGITYNQPATESSMTLGLSLGGKTKVLDGGVTGGFTWLKAITYFDDKGRAVQTISDNYKGGIDRSTNVIDFVGRVLQSKATHIEADLTWTSPLSIQMTGNFLRSTATTSGAASIQQLAAGHNGWIEAIYSENNTTRFFGLNDTNPDAASANINYAFRFTTSNTVNVVENGTTKATITGVVAGDVFRITRTGTAVTYTRNGNAITLSPASTASTTLLMADLSLTNNNATLVGLKSSFSTTTQTITRRFEYDHAGRLLKTWHSLNGASPLLLTQNEYNEIGQLVDKKLHSTNSGTSFKQSVDYRYNIRGWLTSMNDATLANNSTTNDDTGDLFGMNLGYNNDLGIGNTALYNGNISGMTWSNSLGLGTVKQNGYVYNYDPMNRILGSIFKEKTSDWNAPVNGALAETGFDYDLNGNIELLKRNDRRAAGLIMDDLVYNYGTSGNQLKYVKDNGDPTAGFVDGNAALTDDYTYDFNGNMTRDLNKGIGTTLIDGANLIAYNFLNLPETVTKGGNQVRYIYDATGRKLSQVVTFGGQQKQTDYVGEFQYENDVLQSIQHEEGRIQVTKTTTLVTNDGSNTTNMTASNSTLATVAQNGTNTYVRANSGGTTARTGMFPIGGTLNVVAGERYKIRAKGYRTGINPVYLLIKVNGADLNWPGATLAPSVTTEAYAEQIVTIPTGGLTLQVGVVWNTVTLNEQFFLNDFEITKLETTTPEYQYNLKDHLGNVRLTFTSKDEMLSDVATFEAANINVEQSKFLRYASAKRIQSSLFDRTNGIAPTTTTGYSVRLNGGTNEIYGLAKSLSVMPGDVINTEVYYKYIDPTAIDNGTPAGQALLSLLGQIAAGAAGVVVDGSFIGNSTSSFPGSYSGLVSRSNNGSPRAYLNWLVFDRNFGFITGGFKQIETAGKETGSDVLHGFVSSPNITITQPGYVYIYLSNESMQAPNASPVPVEVYFDDFKVTQTKSPVIASQDYYPFGLAFNSYQRENSAENTYLYNQGTGEKTFKTERINDLGLNIDLTKYRAYDPAIGRWWQVDPKSDKEGQEKWSPYEYSYDNPVRYNDPNGDCPECAVIAAKFIAIFSTLSNKESKGALNTLLTNSSTSIQSKSGSSQPTSQIDSKGFAKIADAKVVTDPLAKGSKTLANEGSKDILTATKTVGTVMSLTKVGAMPGAIVSASSTVLDQGRQVMFEGKEPQAAIADGGIEIATDFAFMKLGDAAKTTVKEGEKGKELYDAAVDGHESVLSNFTNWFIDKISGNKK
jgi:RHS repeat-associated protein